MLVESWAESKGLFTQGLSLTERECQIIIQWKSGSITFFTKSLNNKHLTFFTGFHVGFLSAKPHIIRYKLFFLCLLALFNKDFDIHLSV